MSSTELNTFFAEEIGLTVKSSSLTNDVFFVSHNKNLVFIVTKKCEGVMIQSPGKCYFSNNIIKLKAVVLLWLH